MKFDTPPFAASSLIGALVYCCLLLCLSSPCVEGRHPRFTCEGGRGEGDKWFDGCKWCVCQLDGPLCSPAPCSDLVQRVAPCENVGSRWRDGCYQCTCHSYGIECRADASCVVLMQARQYQSQILSPGNCVEPKDDRCICGVDGVPSCTAEVIDRNAIPATTIALTSSSSSGLSEESDNSDYGTLHRVRHRKSKSGRRRVKRVADNRRHAAYGYRHDLPQQHRQEIRAGFPRHRGAGGKHHRHEYNQEIAGIVDERFPASSPSQEDTPTSSASLLIITSNRCRFGVRWYGGGLRCYCDSDSITCGDPQFVATRIDGFRLKNVPCEEGHEWSNEDACQICECKVNGVVLCQRGDTCPLPFLIKALPVEHPSHSRQTDRRSRDFLKEQKDFLAARNAMRTAAADRRAGLKTSSRRGGSSDADEDEEESPYGGKDSAEDSRTLDLPYSSSKEVPLVISTRGDEDKGRRYVTVGECHPGSRWLDGCKRCVCKPNKRKSCDSRRCLRAPVSPRKPSLLRFGHPALRRRPAQRPPSYTVRNKPVQIRPLFPPSDHPCGHNKVGQRYYVKCNRCLCTTHGPKCTAVSCG